MNEAKLGLLLALLVAACGGDKVTVTFTDVPHTLAWVAMQDGEDGQWKVLTDDGGGTYRFEVSGDVYGLAHACEISSGSNVVVIHATAKEVPSPEAACTPPPAETLVQVSGSVAGLTGAETAKIEVGSRQAMVSGAAATWMLDVPGGAHDLFARRITNGTTFDRVIRRNDVTIAAGATFALDFAGEGFAPETHTVTIAGAAASETTQMLVILRNPSGGSPHALAVTMTGELQTLPLAELRADDIHSIVASANNPTAGTFRSVRRMARAASNFTATVPPLQPAPTIDAEATTPYLRPRATLATAGDPDNVTLVYTQRDTAMRQTIFTATATRGWLAATGATTLSVTDFAALQGFKPAWGLRAGEQVQTQHIQSRSTLGVADGFDVSQTADELDGAEYGVTQYLATTTL